MLTYADVCGRMRTYADVCCSRVDSLLFHKNRKYAFEAISNARKACCVTGQFNLEVCTSLRPRTQVA
jgi:hypothetical protein